MRRFAWPALLAGTIIAAPSWSAPPAPAPARVASVTLVVGHRVFPKFADRQQVKLNQEFHVGDTEFTARIVRYVPDFTLDLKSGKVTTRSNEPKNPAFQIIVRQNKVPQDTTWAMLHMPPHFGRRSMLAFRIDRIDFANRTPVIRPESSPHSSGSAPGGHPPTPAAGAPPAQKPGTKTR